MSRRTAFAFITWIECFFIGRCACCKWHSRLVFVQAPKWIVNLSYVRVHMGVNMALILASVAKTLECMDQKMQKALSAGCKTNEQRRSPVAPPPWKGMGSENTFSELLLLSPTKSMHALTLLPKSIQIKISCIFIKVKKHISWHNPTWFIKN